MLKARQRGFELQTASTHVALAFLHSEARVFRHAGPRLVDSVLVHAIPRPAMIARCAFSRESK